MKKKKKKVIDPGPSWCLDCQRADPKCQFACAWHLEKPHVGVWDCVDLIKKEQTQ